jgi:hypothetical protein
MKLLVLTTVLYITLRKIGLVLKKHFEKDVETIKKINLNYKENDQIFI